ncbi:MAG: ribosomal-processing cysteine protease Prp [Tissierellaceae bacterium]|nr:ribosomal-processing cysteine protease Prp [Tissierellaceae bacterium]
MINARFYKDKKGNIRKFTIKGHANYAKRGNDIVCAAVSALAQTTLLSIVKVCGVEENQINYIVEEKTGFLEVELPIDLDNSTLEKTQIVLETLKLGINSIIEIYPEYVKLENGEV